MALRSCWRTPHLMMDVIYCVFSQQASLKWHHGFYQRSCFSTSLKGIEGGDSLWGGGRKAISEHWLKPRLGGRGVKHKARPCCAWRRGMLCQLWPVEGAWMSLHWRGYVSPSSVRSQAVQPRCWRLGSVAWDCWQFSHLLWGQKGQRRYSCVFFSGQGSRPLGVYFFESFHQLSHDNWSVNIIICNYYGS